MWTLQPPEQNKTESDKLTFKTRVKTLEQSSKALSTTTNTIDTKNATHRSWPHFVEKKMDSITLNKSDSEK